VPNVSWSLSPEQAQSFLSLAIGFAVAGLISTGYQLVTERPVFAAPFIIMRNTIRGRRIERRRFEFVMVATVIAGIWSLMSGTVVVMGFELIARVMG
jgi:hypothetical protein